MQSIVTFSDYKVRIQQLAVTWLYSECVSSLMLSLLTRAFWHMPTASVVSSLMPSLCTLPTHYYSRAAFISFRSFRLCSYYSRVASIQRNAVCPASWVVSLTLFAVVSIMFLELKVFFLFCFVLFFFLFCSEPCC